MATILVSLILFLAGCQTQNGVKQPPPSPIEAKILAQTIMSVAIHKQKMDPRQIDNLLSIFQDARSTVQLAMADDPSSVEPITLDYIGNLDPVYQEATKGMLQIFIIRLRPYFQQGQEGQVIAAVYIDHVFDGAILACQLALAKERQGPEPFPPMPANPQPEGDQTRYLGEPWPVIK